VSEKEIKQNLFTQGFPQLQAPFRNDGNDNHADIAVALNSRRLHICRRQGVCVYVCETERERETESERPVSKCRESNFNGDNNNLLYFIIIINGPII
jgi:hypothetical protein